MKKNAEFVGVDEKYIPEDEKYVDESILGNKEETREYLKNAKKKGIKVAKGVAIGYICFIVLIFVFVICVAVGIFIRSAKFEEEYNRTVDKMYEQHNQAVEQKIEEQNQRIEKMIK